MRWFEHQTDDRETTEARIIRKRFGNEGWGVWQNLMEVIGQNMDGENSEYWGCVSEDQSMEKLAQDCYCTLEYFRTFVAFCDEVTILDRKRGRLFSPFVLKRMNEYASRLRAKSDRRKKQVNTKEVDNPEIPERTEIPEGVDVSALHTQHNTITTQSQKQIQKKEEEPAPSVAGPPKVSQKERESTELQRLVSYLEKITGARPANFGKQAQAWKMMQSSGYSEKNIQFCIEAMWEDDYWKKIGFDLTNVMNNIAKIKQRYSERKN